MQARKAGSKIRPTWVLGNGGLQLGGQKRPGKARERRGEWLTTIMTAMQEKAKEGRRDGRGDTRVGMAGLGLFDQKSEIAVTMPIATNFKFCIGHRIFFWCF
jgi:hypothetical protein